MISCCWTSLFFLLGIKGADEDELRKMASTPYDKHVYNVTKFNQINLVQKKIIAEVCSAVDDQLSSLVNREESKLWPPPQVALVAYFSLDMEQFGWIMLSVITCHPMVSRIKSIWKSMEKHFSCISHYRCGASV